MSEEGQQPTNHVFSLSSIPPNCRESAKHLVKDLDADGDGCIDAAEFMAAIESLKDSRKQNRNLIKLVTVQLIAFLLLIGAIFGVSIVAARLAKDTTVDEDSGILESKDMKSAIKTGEAIEWTDLTDLVDSTNDELSKLKYIELEDGDLNFAIKGYARAASGDQVLLLVEGGTITFKQTIGLFNATGDALVLFEAAGRNFDDGIIDTGASGRKLQETQLPNFDDGIMDAGASGRKLQKGPAPKPAPTPTSSKPSNKAGSRA